MCTNPSWWTPTSTKAPNAATLVTTPSRTMPGCKSSSFSTPSRKLAVLKAGRGSRPGFSSSAKIGHEAVPRDLAHRGQHAFVEGRLAQLLARKVDLDSDDLDHVPPQDCEMRF